MKGEVLRVALAIVALLTATVPVPQARAAAADGSSGEGSPTPTATAHPAVSRAPPTPYPFEPGEQMEYVVSWLKIRAGRMRVEVKEHTEFAGEPAIRFRVTGETSRTFSRFFKVRDQFDSFVRARDLVSLFFVKDIREGRYRAKRQEIFDHQAGISIYRDRRSAIPTDARDVIASLFYLRTLDLEVGSRIPLNAVGDGRSLRVDVLVKGPREVDVPAGRFRVLELRPMADFEGRVYKSESSSLSIFLSEDERRIPVLITVKLAFGKIRAELRQLMR